MPSETRPTRALRLRSPLLPVTVLVLLALELVTPFKVWALLLTGFAGMLLLAYLWARSLRDGLHLEREVRFGWKQVGDHLRERVTLENSGWASCFWVEINDHSDMQDYNISAITEISGRHTRSWHTQGTCSQRGLYTLGPVTLRTGDPFGIFAVTVSYRQAVTMMVAPPVLPLPEIEIASGGRVGEGRSAVKSLQQTVTSAGVREYLPGDSLRHLHWPTTARTGKLHVRVFDDEPASDWHILLDLNAEVQVGEGQRSTLEHGIMLAASLLNRGLDQRRPVGVIAQGDAPLWFPPAAGEDQLWKVLRALAQVKPGALPLAKLLNRIRGALAPRTSLVIITADTSLEWLKTVELLRRSGVTPTVLLLDPRSFGGKRDLEILRQHLLKRGIAHRVIPADLLSPPEPQPEDRLDWLLSRPLAAPPPPGRWEMLRNWIGQAARLGLPLWFFFLGFVNALDFAVRGLERSLIWAMILGGALVGGLLARTRLSGRAAAFWTALAGLGAVTWRVGNFAEPVREAASRFGDWIAQGLDWIFREGTPPDAALLVVSLSRVIEKLQALGFRLLGWFIDLFQGNPIYDPVVTAFLWGLAVWSAAGWTLWTLARRRDPLRAVLPPLALVAVSLVMVWNSSFGLTLMFGAASALLVIANFDFRKRTWEQKQVRSTAGVQLNIATTAALLAVGLMLLAALVPAFSLERLNKALRTLTGWDRQSQIAESLGLEPQPEPKAVPVLQSKLRGGLPNAHLIGAGPELADQVVMTVRLTSLDAESAPWTPLYLRSLVYDRYTGSGWESLGTRLVDYPAGEQLPLTNPGSAYRLRQQVQIVGDTQGIIYTAGELLSVDQPFQAAWRLYDPENGIYDLFGATVSAETYRADSTVRLYSENDLRAAGQNYPAWVRERYLSLPADVPERVTTLARDLTADAPTPYDRALALETYLRTFPYTLDVSTPPPRRDVTEYFLFDLQKGYCDYYATAMVVMARSAGLPARYVVGYIGENYDDVTQVYLITADQAHAWPEIYFPGYGWIAFEPTAGRPALQRAPDEPPALPEEAAPELAPLVPETRPLWADWPRWLGMLALAALLLAALWWGWAEWRLYRTPAEDLPARVFSRLYRMAHRLGMPLEPGDTACRFAARLDGYFALFAGSRLPGLGDESASEAVHRLAEAYVRQTFAPAGTAPPDSAEILRAYRRLRRRLWLLHLLKTLYRLKFLRPALGQDVRRFVTALEASLIV